DCRWRPAGTRACELPAGANVGVWSTPASLCGAHVLPRRQDVLSGQGTIAPGGNPPGPTPDGRCENRSDVVHAMSSNEAEGRMPGAAGRELVMDDACDRPGGEDVACTAAPRPSSPAGRPTQAPGRRAQQHVPPAGRRSPQPTCP